MWEEEELLILCGVRSNSLHGKIDSNWRMDVHGHSLPPEPVAQKGGSMT